MAAPSDYSPNWSDIAEAVKEELSWHCERCWRPHSPEDGYMLGVHHLDGDKANNQRYNLAALCQRCHLSIQAQRYFGQLWMLPPPYWLQPHLIGRSLDQLCTKEPATRSSGGRGPRRRAGLEGDGGPVSTTDVGDAPREGVSGG